MSMISLSPNFVFKIYCFCTLFNFLVSEDILGCGGYVKSSFSISYSRVEVKLYTKQGSLKYKTDCAPHNGYYFIPLYDKGDYILKIEPLAGWEFEPNSVALHIDGSTDPCSQNQDINFNFKGFSVSGKVLSYNQNSGPSGIRIALKNAKGELLQETTTVESGSYDFAAVLPGSYVIEASHEKWTFDKNLEHIRVEQDNVKALNAIVVSGFDVKGQVSSEDEPIQGVYFLLFSKEKLKKKLAGCTAEIVQGFSGHQDLEYLCHATSQSDGSFNFPSLPSGAYTLIPFYKGEHIEFDVLPSDVEFEVKQNSFVFPVDFRVTGFSVSGRVLEAVNGEGLEGAKVFINNQLHTTTQAKGIYHLERMRAGIYEIEVKVPHVYFDKVTMKVTPNTPQLPNIYASKFSICGHVHIEQHPPGLAEDDRFISIKNTKLETSANVPVQIEGDFCTIAEAGDYVIELVISDVERNNGLRFSPPKHKVMLRHEPLLDILFTQFLAVVRGQVQCIGNCGALMVTVNSLNSDGIHFSTTTSEDGVFEFKGCLPGHYVLAVEKGSWCFQAESIEFEIDDQDVLDLKLHQTGFHTDISLSHSSSFKVKYPSGKTQNLELQNAKNGLCLPEAGIYEFVPAGCHLYKSNVFKFDTNNPSKLSLTPSKYLVTGTVFTEVNVSDINVTILKRGGADPEQIQLKEPLELREKTFRYIFSLFVEPNTNLDIIVTSSLLLFRPAVARVQVLEDCIDNAVQIKGKTGLFIEGTITPMLDKVRIRIVHQGNMTLVIEVYTNATGNFVVGPLDGDNNYIVSAHKEGYFFTAQGKLGNFKAFKLAEIIVKVQSEDGLPLPGVLLSLSGGVDYRKNSLTRKDGKISFIGLSPGKYFLRPMLKEYQFMPPTKMIDVEEGTQINLSISGKRDAYSLFGIVNSLTGESEVGVAVEAVGLDGPCGQYQEDGVSEQDGTFRIRGLQPGCKYSLRLKRGNDVNQHIERATPTEHILKVENKDIMDIRIIVFRHFSQLDVSGSIFTNQDYLSTLKVRLYNDENPDQYLQTITLGRSAFFFLPSMAIDQKTYTLRLDSTLPKNSYQYDPPSVTFCANTSFYHFSFTFNPQPKSSDQEVTQGSILALPFAVLVAFVIYNHNKVMSVVTQGIQSVSSVVGPVRNGHSTDSLSAESSNMRKKMKPRRTQ